MSATIHDSLATALEAPHHYHQEAAQYDMLLGRILTEAQTVLDIGSGAGGFERSDVAQRKTVVGVDVYGQYYQPPYWIEHPISALAQELPFKDEQFDATVSFFTFQHIKDAEVGSAVREAVRVTKTAEDDHDLSKGLIIVSPVFRASKAIEGLSRLPWTAGVVGLLNTSPQEAHSSMAARRDLHDSLVIHKTSDLTPERTDELAKFLEHSQVLRPHTRTLGEMATRMFQRATKHGRSVR